MLMQPFSLTVITEITFLFRSWLGPEKSCRFKKSIKKKVKLSTCYCQLCQITQGHLDDNRSYRLWHVIKRLGRLLSIKSWYVLARYTSSNLTVASQVNSQQALAVHTRSYQVILGNTRSYQVIRSHASCLVVWNFSSSRGITVGWTQGAPPLDSTLGLELLVANLEKRKGMTRWK